MKLSNDPLEKSMQLNMLLKANNMDLVTYCGSAGMDPVKLQYELGIAGIKYDPVERQFKP